jgi:hypothetical protein
VRVDLDEKNISGWLGAGEENVLTRFVNLPGTRGNSKPALEFTQQFGELVAARVPLDRVPPSDYYKFVSIFQRVWEARTDEEIKRASAELGGVLNRTAAVRVIDRPELTVDLTANQPISISATSATVWLLDMLVMALIRHRKELGICEKKGKACRSPFYLKSHGRQRFCPRCADLGRKEKKEQWWSENREQFIKKWRKQRLLKRKQTNTKRKEKREK